MSIQLSRL